MNDTEKIEALREWVRRSNDEPDFGQFAAGYLKALTEVQRDVAPLADRWRCGMTECRPHWDDYLLASVMIHCNDIYQCYAVIAAVEDWQKKRWASITQSPMEVAVQFNALEAAIQRARELADRVARYHGDGLPRIKPRDIYRALDGDA